MSKYKYYKNRQFIYKTQLNGTIITLLDTRVPNDTFHGESSFVTIEDLTDPIELNEIDKILYNIED